MSSKIIEQFQNERLNLLDGYMSRENQKYLEELLAGSRDHQFISMLDQYLVVKQDTDDAARQLDEDG